jgi:hypothetical protein
MGHALMGAGELWTNLSISRARLHANRAIELNPSASMAHHFSGCISGFAGDLKAAIATQNDVYRVDPRYGHADVVEADLGLWHLLEGNLERAASTCSARSARIPRTSGPDSGRSSWRDSPATRRSRARRFRRSRSSEEPWTSVYLAVSYLFQDAKHAETFRKGLRAAEALEAAVSPNHFAPATSFRNRGLLRSESKLGSIVSHACEPGKGTRTRSRVSTACRSVVSEAGPASACGAAWSFRGARALAGRGPSKQTAGRNERSRSVA